MVCAFRISSSISPYKGCKQIVMNEERDMWNVLFKRPELSRQRTVWPKALILPIVLLMGVGQVQAQSATCFRSRDLTPSTNWSMAPSGSVFKNGDVVGRTSAYAQYYVPIAHGETIRIDANGQIVSNPYRAVPLSGMPGLGLIVRWSGYSSTVTLTPVGPGAPSGTIISSSQWTSMLQARTTANYTLTQFYSFELVVIDDKVYRGGKLTFTEANKVRVLIANQRGTGTPQLCVDGYIDPMAALTGTVQVPELPKPALPSCRFSTSTLKQSVTLGPVDPGQIPSSSTLRPSGEAGQNHFLIEGTGCTKDTKLSFYFTDTRDMATTKNYLLTSNPAVGIRLFHRGEYEPLPFGPAPSGSWVPPHYAPSVGPATADGATLSTGFTAQYVRLPNKTEADIRPGPLEAAATFVIVYP
ncbi:type 1 fimbrial protein [Alcaligenes faecalis]|nr:type 1 fimbrial protein [Alcaligenes faecalis]MBY6317043.1 type 1 fimbrial protein [Alcaligenes faecalis]MBY6389750.1 type 1 fimbrial protein [Alcaligenes faecalis]